MEKITAIDAELEKTPQVIDIAAQRQTNSAKLEAEARPRNRLDAPAENLVAGLTVLPRGL